MDDHSPRDSSTEDPRQGFLRALPRKAVEIKATFGALIADPRSTRMRDELRRRLHAFYTLARSYQLPKLAEEIRACVDILDATKALPSLARPHIDSLAAHIAAFSGAAEQDAGDGGARPSSPSGTRHDPSRVPTTRISVPGVPRPQKHTLPPDGAEAPATPERQRTSPVPYRTLPPGTTLRKGMTAASGHAAAVHILFVGGSVRANGLHEALPAEVELLVTRTALDAAQRARDAGPDVIVAEGGGPADGVALVQTLRADPVTEFFPVLLLATGGATVEALRERCPDAADVLPESTDGAALWDAIERFLGGATASTASYELGDLTLDELTRALQDELRRGIVGAATPRARGARIHMGAGSDVLAATWEAITRIREVVERRSNGAVRFELPAAPRGMPGTQIFTLGSEDVGAPPEVGGDDPLPGRRVLVVDDDPAVLATFRVLLKDAGAEVHECADGLRALALSRQLRPDLLISDIVMPGLDGFALCRAVRRDPSLRHMPVILLSWKDDLLVRMRELGAQAQGYLRKEVGGDAILARVREALRLRGRILKRVRELSGNAEVRGRLERVGLYPLLEAAATLGDASVTVSDTSSVTELHLRGARLVSALRTAHDGSLVRGEVALRPVLGVTSARFAVVRSKTVVRENLQGTLQELLTRSARAVVCLEESLSGDALTGVHRVDFDREGALAYARSLPGRLRTQLERIIEGDSPAELIARESAAPSDLEPLLVELVRRGVVRGAFGAGGEDLAAQRAALPEAPVAPSGPALVPAPAPVPPRPARADDPSDVSLADAVWRELRDSVHEGPLERKVSPAPLPAAKARPSDPPLVTLEPVSLSDDDLPPLDIESDFDAIKTPAAPVPAGLLAASIPQDAARKAAVDAKVAAQALTRKLPRATSVPPEALASPGPGRGRPGSDEVSAETLEIPDDVIEGLQRDSNATPDPDEVHPRVTPNSVPSIEFEMLTGAPRPPPTPPGALQSSTPSATKSAPPAPSTPAPAPPRATPAPSTPPRSAPPRAAPPRTTAPPPPARPRRRDPADGWSTFRRTAALLLGVGAAFAGAYYSVRAYLWSRPVAVHEAPAVIDEDAAPGPLAEGPPEPDAAVEVADAAAAFSVPPRAAVPLGEYSDAAPWLDGGALPARAGVLVVASPDGGAAPRVEIDQRDVGEAPLHAVLAEGLHTVRFRDGQRWRYQFATVRAGQAVVLQTPQ